MNTVSRVMILVLRVSSYNALKICQRITDPNSRASASVVANVEGQTDKRTGSQNCAMPKAGATKSNSNVKTQ